MINAEGVYKAAPVWYLLCMITTKPDSAEESAPRWQLSSVFSSFYSDSSGGEDAFSAALARMAELLAALDSACTGAPAPDDAGKTAVWFSGWYAVYDEYRTLAETTESYAYAAYSVNTGSAAALSALSQAEAARQPYSGIFARLLEAVAAREPVLTALSGPGGPLAEYAGWLEELFFLRKKQMTPAEEDLAAELARFGAEAWSRLQDRLTASAVCCWDKTTGEQKTLVELRALAYSPDREVRKKAFACELECCRQAAEPVAAALRAVKGVSACLDRRRNWSGFSGSGLSAGCPPLEKAAWQGKISSAALDALLSAMEDAVPFFARYLKKKAGILGTEKCAFFDLFAPLPASFSGRRWSWAETQDYVTECFASFSDEMADFARHAFTSGWIDAEMRPGKIGGAYMTAFPLAGESRVMCNFDGSFNSVMTVAHELGHAWHFEVMKDLPAFRRDVPMTLAETASIFAETLVFRRSLQTCAGEERLARLEGHLQDGCQTLCDILSRFYFEKAAFAAAENGSPSADDFCAWMAEAQKKAYGGALDEQALHPYMWLVKCHYYSADLAFYNFPYAFGQLFALALFSRFQEEGKSFAPVYKNLLRMTGSQNAGQIAALAGFRLEDPEFWRRGTDVFRQEADGWERLFQKKEKTDIL